MTRKCRLAVGVGAAPEREVRPVGEVEDNDDDLADG